MFQTVVRYIDLITRHASRVYLSFWNKIRLFRVFTITLAKMLWRYLWTVHLSHYMESQVTRIALWDTVFCVTWSAVHCTFWQMWLLIRANIFPLYILFTFIWQMLYPKSVAYNTLMLLHFYQSILASRSTVLYCRWRTAIKSTSSTVCYSISCSLLLLLHFNQFFLHFFCY